MPNEIKPKHGSSVAMTITLASLATSSSGVGRQSDMVNNANIGQFIHVYYKITTGTSPTANRKIVLYLIKGDDNASPNIRTDGAGASDAAWTVQTATPIAVINVTATSDKTYQGSVLVRNPGGEFGIGVVNDSGVALNATGANHEIRYVTENTEVQ